MAVQLNIPFETLRDLIKQLPAEERQHLLADLLQETARERELTAQEKIALLDAAKLNHKVLDQPSIRREDWYGDDGR